MAAFLFMGGCLMVELERLLEDKREVDIKLDFIWSTLLELEENP